MLWFKIQINSYLFPPLWCDVKNRKYCERKPCDLLTKFSISGNAYEKVDHIAPPYHVLHNVDCGDKHLHSLTISVRWKRCLVWFQRFPFWNSSWKLTDNIYNVPFERAAKCTPWETLSGVAAWQLSVVLNWQHWKTNFWRNRELQKSKKKKYKKAQTAMHYTAVGLSSFLAALSTTGALLALELSSVHLLVLLALFAVLLLLCLQTSAKSSTWT